MLRELDTLPMTQSLRRAYITLTGVKIVEPNYYKPAYLEKTGAILGTVGDWLNEMGAGREHLAPAIEKVKAPNEYKHLLSLGFEDLSSAGDLKNGTLNFVGAYRPIIGSDAPPVRVRRKVLANGNIRAFSAHDENVDTAHGWRPATLHLYTIKNDPHSTGRERIVKTMRQSLEQLHKHYAASYKRHFLSKD